MPATVTALITGMPKDMIQSTNQKRALDVLKGKGIEVTEVDGTLAENKEQRGALFKVSGMVAVYPQFFIVAEGGGDPVFVGDYEAFEGFVENAGYPAEVLAANPAIQVHIS